MSITQLTQSQGNGKVQFTQKSVFEASEVAEESQKASNRSLEDQMENELAIMESELETLQENEEFLETFLQDYQAYENDPSNYSKFEKVMQDLQTQDQNDPNLEAQIQQIESEGENAQNKETHWHNHGSWYHFWHGESHSDPHYFKHFSQKIMPQLQTIAEKSVGSSASFQNLLFNGQALFRSRIAQLSEDIKISMDILKIIEGSSGNSQVAMFEMESLLMDLEQLQINSNTQKSQQQQDISNQTANNLQKNLEKIEKAIKESEHHSGGLFGFVEDFFKSISKLVADIAKGTYYVASGQEDKAKKAFSDLTKGFQVLEKGFEEILKGNFKQGFEVLFTAALLTMLYGPMGVSLLGTKFGEDMKNITTLIIDSKQAFFQLLAAGALALSGDSKDASKLMESDKKLGEDILANPALKTISDIAMVAIIVVMALTGDEAMAAIMLTLFVASEEGWMQEGTEKLAKAIGGPNNAAAKVIADVIVIAAITLLTAGAGAGEAFYFSASTDAAVAAGEEEEIEMVEMIDGKPVDEGASTASSAVEPGGKQTSRGIQVAKRAASMGAYGFGSALGSSSFAIDILQATSKKNSELLAIMLELVQEIVSAVTVSIGGFLTMTESLSNTARATEETVSQLTQLASKVKVSGGGVSAISGAAQGGEKIIQTAIQKRLSTYKANVELDEGIQHSADQMIKQTAEELKKLVKNYEELIATAFKTPAEVANAEIQALIQA